MPKNKGKKSQGIFVPLNYARHSVVVSHTHGTALTVVTSDTSLNTWTRATTRRIDGEVVGPGITTRASHAHTLRFTGDAKVVSDNRG